MFDEYGAYGFTPLAVNLWEDMSIVRTYAQSYTFPFFRDGGAAWNLYRMNGYIPLNYVVDTAGLVVGSMEGFNETVIRSWIEPYLVGVAEEPSTARARDLTLEAGPNPARTGQTVVFTMPAAGSATLAVYSSSGELVKTVVNGTVNAGRNTATWNLTDNLGRTVPNGLYFYELSAAGQRLTAKVSVFR